MQPSKIIPMWVLSLCGLDPEQAERERTWALVSARAEGISIRTLATAVGLSPSRVHQLVADADLDALDTAFGELRAAGWPAPEDPDSGEDTELGGRDSTGQEQPTGRERLPMPTWLGGQRLRGPFRSYSGPTSYNRWAGIGSIWGPRPAIATVRS